MHTGVGLPLSQHPPLGTLGPHSPQGVTTTGQLLVLGLWGLSLLGFSLWAFRVLCTSLPKQLGFLTKHTHLLSQATDLLGLLWGAPDSRTCPS